jgi:hypothetical protein
MTDARSLIRSMLQNDPTKRPSIEAILTHPWFKSTIVDKMPEQSDGHLVSPGLTPRFDEPFSGKQSLYHQSQIPSRGSSPLHGRPTQPPIYEESDQSETSLQDSEFGKADTVSTAPTTAESSGDVGEGEDEDPIKRVHSGEFSQTEKDLEMLHSNTSQSTIRRTGSDSPGLSTPGIGQVKTRVAVKSGLEGHQETDEEVALEGLNLVDDHTLPLLMAQHTRTPSRTKRRSVSSTMSLERRHSHHSSSGQWTTYPPEDYILKLNETRAEPFSTPSEKYLLNQLSEIGFNIGQITHSVTNNACDSSAAAWWMLRAKQAERGETDEVILAKTNAVERKNERAAAYARDERKRHKERERATGEKPANVKFIDQPSFMKTPSSPTVELGSPIRSTAPLSVSPEAITSGHREMPFPPQPGLLHPHSNSTETTPIRPQIDQSRSFDTLPKAPPAANVVDPATAESSPSKDAQRPTKTRSPSMSMLQRATSALVPGSWKNEDRANEKAIVDDQDGKDEKKSTSPTKLTKPLPRSKIVKSESENSLAQTLNTTITPTQSRNAEAGPSRRMSTPLLTTTNSASENVAGPSKFASPAISTTASPNHQPSCSKVSKREAFWSWNSLRYMFNDPRRRRSRDDTVAGKEHKSGPAVVLSRGISGRGPHVNRMIQPIRRSSSDGRPIYSRRSSSVNSRRSSFNSGMPHTSSHDALPTLGLGRRQSGRSHGSQTPTSEREHNPLSRPSSIHGDSHLRPSSRRSSQNLRSPSMQSDHSVSASARGFRYSTPASPLHNYQRRAPIGTDSRRVRHIRVIPEGHMIRSESVASSIRSNASSRASSRDRATTRDRDRDRDDSDYETGREDASIRSRHRSRSDLGLLAQQIHRKNSPLTLPGHFHHHQRSHTLKPPEPKPKPKAPLRDVFQGKEEEWVSDDEDIYSGGLGQKGQQLQSSSTKSVQWEPNARAMFTNHGGSGGKYSSNRKHAHGHAQKGQSRSRRNSSDEEDSKRGTAAGTRVMEEKAPTPVESVGAAGRRRGIPSGRGTAPVIEEEEEEEE